MPADLSRWQLFFLSSAVIRHFLYGCGCPMLSVSRNNSPWRLTIAKMAAEPRGEDILGSASELDTDEEVNWLVLKKRKMNEFVFLRCIVEWLTSGMLCERVPTEFACSLVAPTARPPPHFWLYVPVLHSWRVSTCRAGCLRVCTKKQQHQKRTSTTWYVRTHARLSQPPVLCAHRRPALTRWREQTSHIWA